MSEILTAEEAAELARDYRDRETSIEKILKEIRNEAVIGRFSLTTTCTRGTGSRLQELGYSVYRGVDVPAVVTIRWDPL